MKNWENQNFEAEWKQAFEGAEVAPSAFVWQTLDFRLIQAENISMKGRVIFYQRMAAGLVGALLLVGGYSFYKPEGTSTGQSLTQNQETQHNDNSNAILTVDSALINNFESLNSKNQSGAGGRTSTDGHVQSKIESLRKNPSSQEARIDPLAEGTDDHEILGTNLNKNISGNRSNGSLEANSPVATIYLMDVEKLPIIIEPDDICIAYRVADARPAIIVPLKKKTLTPENTWASVGIAAGSCTSAVDRASVLNSRSGISASQYYGLNSTGLSGSGSDEKVKSETSMSFLVSAGRRIFKRWVAQGGVSYVSQTSKSSTDILTAAPANETSKAMLDGNFSTGATNLVTYSTPSEINNTIQFISVPLQAGYMLVDRKFGIQINGGISPDFFLKNTVYNQTTNQKVVSTATGSNENYKTVSLSGLGSAEVSYRFSRHYRVSIIPGFRYTLTPIYKEDLLASAKPFVVDIGLKFRYVFDN